MTNTTVLHQLENHEGISLQDTARTVKYYFSNRRISDSYRDSTRQNLKGYKFLKAYDGLELNAEKTAITFVGENLVQDNVNLANNIIRLHEDGRYSYLDSIETVADERAFVSRTYKVELSQLTNYLLFIRALWNDYKYNEYKRIPVVSYDEYVARKMANGQKIGRYISRCGASDSFVGSLDSLVQGANTTLYATLSGATQDIIGMSYFGKEWSSCQNWDGCSDIDYALHNYAGATTKEQFVFYLHESLDDLNHTLGNEHMLTRTTVLRGIEQGFEVFYHGRTYGNSERTLHNEVITLLDGHFNSYTNADKTSEFRVYPLAGGAVETITSKDISELVISVDHGTDFSVTCPLCDGDGTVRVEINDEYGNYLGRTDMECQLCNGHGNYDIELDYNYDGDTATDYIDRDDLEELVSSETVFKFYDGHAFEGFVNKLSQGVKVYVTDSEINDYVRARIVASGKILTPTERTRFMDSVIGYCAIFKFTADELVNMDDSALLKLTVNVNGLSYLRDNKFLLGKALEIINA